MRNQTVAVFVLLAAGGLGACADSQVTDPARFGYGPRANVTVQSTGPLLISPTALEFGEVAAGGVSATQAVTVRNVSGTAQTLALTGGTPTGPFAFSQNCDGVTVPAGGACQLTFALSPTEVGDFSGVASGDVNGHEFSIALHGTGVPPRLLVTPTGLQFGEVGVGSTSAPQVAVVTNTGATALTIDVTGGSPGSPFSLDENCDGVMLAPGASCGLAYTFTPTVSGPATAVSNVTLNGEAFAIALAGSGGTQQQLLVTPTALDFGQIVVGTTAQQAVKVKNTGLGAVTVTLTGGSAGSPFGSTENCSSVTLAAGEECEITYSYEPTGTGGIDQALSALTINGTAYSIALTGAGREEANEPQLVFRVTPFGLNFGSVPVGGTSAAQVVSVTNMGLTQQTVTLSGGTPTGDFTFSQNCHGASLAPGASCQLTYAFAPDAGGSQTVTASGSVNGQDFEIALRGVGVSGGAEFLITPTGLAFGDVAAGSVSAAQTVTVTNVSAAALVVSLSGATPSDPFALTENCEGETLQPGESCQLSYTFAPDAVGAANDVAAGSINGQPFTVSLQGNGVGASFLITPVGLDFGGVTIGATSPPQTVRVTNTGKAAVVVTLADGSPDDPFGMSEDCHGANLAVGAWCALSFTFTPTAAGEVVTHATGTVNGQAFDIALRGTGVSASAPVFELLAFDPPVGVRPVVQAASTLPIRFAVGDENGLIGDQDAVALAASCAVRVRFSGTPETSECASYSRGAHRFSALLRVPRATAAGTYVVTAEVVEGGAVLGSLTFEIEVRAAGS